MAVSVLKQREKLEVFMYMCLCKYLLTWSSVFLEQTDFDIPGLSFVAVISLKRYINYTLIPRFLVMSECLNVSF